MARVATVIGIALATAVAGCITPQGYDRPDGGGTAAGGAPAQGGSSGAGGAATTGAGGTVTGTGGALTGAGGAATGTGGSAAGGKGGTGAPGGTTGAGGTVAGTGGTVTTTGGAGASGCKVMIPLPYTEDFEKYPINKTPPNNWLYDTADADSTKGSFMVVSDGGSNVLQGTASSSTWVADIGGDQCWTDYTFQVDIKFISGSSEEFGVWGRFSVDSGDKGAYYTAYMDDSAAVQLRVRQNGSTTTLGSKSKPTTSGSPVAGMVYTFVLDLHGGTLSVSVNGTSRVSMVMDPTFTTGAIGLAVSDGTVEFDNIKVTQ